MQTKILLIYLFLSLIYSSKDTEEVTDLYNDLWQELGECFKLSGNLNKSPDVTFYYTDLNISVPDYGTALISNYVSFVINHNVTWLHYVPLVQACKFGRIVDSKTYFLVHATVILHVTNTNYDPAGHLLNYRAVTWHDFVYSKDESNVLKFKLEHLAYGGGFWVQEPGLSNLTMGAWVSPRTNGTIKQGWNSGIIFNRRRCTMNPNGFNFVDTFMNP